ncbi:MAG: HlyD family efflux transporter periplasmic adaptor subunit [Pseudomonadales bacterium]
MRHDTFLPGLLCLLLAACDGTPSAQIVLGTLERDRIELAADSAEPIQTILVREGQPVVAGDVLIIQNAERAEAALLRARAEEATARAALEEAEKGPRSQAIAQGRARLEAARSARATARFELDRQASLVERNFSSKSQLDILRGRYEEAQAREQEAQAALDELAEGTRNERIDQARNQYAAAVATVKNLSITLDRASIRAPVDGVIEALPMEIGERPLAGATVVAMLAEGPTYARVHIPETLRTRVTTGTGAQVHVDGYPEPFAATVRWVSLDASFTPYFALHQHDRTRLSYLAEIDLTMPAGAVLPVGVPVEVAFPDLQ